MEKISEHISYEEATRSTIATRHHLKNDPGPVELAAMKHVAALVFEPLRLFIGLAIGISSFFRTRTLNALVGGSDTSQHVKGEAIDLNAKIFGGLSNKQIFDYILNHLPFDQLIWEFGTDGEPDWVHVSLRITGNRHQALRSVKRNGNTIYLNYKPNGTKESI
jgi:zinc D-Ala-D-Ala carboxypeptidase